MRRVFFLKKLIFNFSFLLLLFTVVTNVRAEPTRQFFLEKAEVAAPNTFSIDVYNTTFRNPNSGPREIRGPVFGGELLVSEFYTGYKYVVKPDLAVFGWVSLDSDSDNTSVFLAGAAYDMPINQEFSIGFNGELAVDDDFDFLAIASAGGYFDILQAEDSGMGKLQIGLEVSLGIDEDDSDSGIAFGVRWIPIPQVTIDFLLYNDLGNFGIPGLTGTDGSIQTPAGLRANLTF